MGHMKTVKEAKYAEARAALHIRLGWVGAFSSRQENLFEE